MYFPILRGKQFELIALKEFAQQCGNSIVPVIEAVKKDTKGLKNTCEILMQNNAAFSVIVNPNVGDIQQPSALISFITANALNNYPNFILGIRCISEAQTDGVLQLLAEHGLAGHSICLIHDNILDEGYMASVIASYDVRYNFLNINSSRFRRYRRLFMDNTLVSMEDPFALKQRNADYLEVEDEFFSVEYLNFRQDGIAGFSDYLTIGFPFNEGGFLPYAVAIHLTYLHHDETIRIRHFVSNSNEDYSDVPGKFAEALQKLVDFLRTSTLNTVASREFKEMHDRGHYPGLGTIKKLSILNHMELIHQLLN